MWTFNQSTGELSLDGQPVALGYSGHDNGRNNPELQAAANVGPLPCGFWTIHAPEDTPDHGPFVMRLQPDAETNTFGRSGFLIHGDSREHPGEASHGCIIAARAIREKIWASNDRRLEVIDGLDPFPKFASGAGGGETTALPAASDPHENG